MSHIILFGQQASSAHYNFTGQVPRDQAVSSFVSSASVAPLAGLVAAASNGNGFTGPAGSTGSTGATNLGYTGSSGMTGPTGVNQVGPTGFPGRSTTGPTGVRGQTGSVGALGSSTVTGATGSGMTYLGTASVPFGTVFSSLTFSNIPQTFTHLRLIGSFMYEQLTGETPNIITFQVNNDTTANYDWQMLSTDALNLTGIIAQNATADTSILLSSSVLVNNFSSLFPLIIDIPNYSIVGGAYKTIQSLQATAWSATTDQNMFVTHGTWRNTAAITSFTFRCSPSSPLNEGIAMDVYGY